MRISLIRTGLFPFSHVSLCKFPFGQGRVMQDGLEQATDSSESSLSKSNGQISPAPSGQNAPGRCPVHAVGSMLNPLAFDELAGGGEDVWIACSGQVYRLRRTKLEKLILTK